MKNLAKIPFVFVLTLFLFSFKGDNGELKWYSWNEGYEKGMEEDKVILVDVYTDWCGWCKKMDKDTYANKNVIEMIEGDFIPIKFNPEEKNKTYIVDGKELNGKQLYGMLSNGKSTGYPTTYFLYPKKREIKAIPGYQGPQRFKTTLKQQLAYKGDSSEEAQ